MVDVTCWLVGRDRMSLHSFFPDSFVSLLIVLDSLSFHDPHCCMDAAG